MEERYEIREKIGQGGIGSVHRAFDHKMNRHVAIKRIVTKGEDPKHEAEATKQMMAEVGALSALQHPHIVIVFDVGSDEDGPYVVMELIDGKTLDEIVENAPLTWDDFRIVAKQSLEALLAAHDLDMIHSDLKPPNIMLTWMPSGAFQIKIVDFGLATMIHNQSQEELEKLESVYGSVFFMPPEQFERKVLDVRSDLYSLGCCFYQALAGSYPFDGDTGVGVMHSHLHHTVRPIEEIRSDIPPWACDWVMWLINRDPEDRPSSAREALANFLKNEKMTAAVVNQAVAAGGQPRLLASGSPPPAETDPIPVSHETASVDPALAQTASVLVGFRKPGRPKPHKNLLKIVIPVAAVSLFVLMIWLMMKRNEGVRQKNANNSIFAMATDRKVKQVLLSDGQLKMVFNYILNSKPGADLAPAYVALVKATAGDGGDMDSAIANFATTGTLPGGVRRKLFEEVIGKRESASVVPILIRFSATAKNADEASAAFEAIRSRIREEHAVGLLGLIASTDHEDVRQDAESEMSEIIARSGSRNALASLITHAKEKSNSPSNREHFDRLLAQCGSPNQPVVKALPNPPGHLPGPGPLAGTSSVLPSQRESPPPPAAGSGMSPRPRRAKDATLINTYDPATIRITASSFFNAANRPELTVDGSGLEHATGRHANGTQLSWTSSNNGNVGIEWIQWDLGATYHLDSIHVWNYNDGVRFKSGINELDIYVSAIADPGDPEGAGANNWTKIGHGVSFPMASGEPTYTGFDLATETGIDLPAAEVRHVRFDLISSHWGDGTPPGNLQEEHRIGLAEIQFFARPQP